jgi:hypothetical protein
LWQRLATPNCAGAISVHHEFDDMYGGFRDECDWEMIGDQVHMSVKGNNSDYVHHLVPWQYKWVGPTGESFEVHTERSVGGFMFLTSVRPVRHSVRIPLKVGDVKEWKELKVSSDLAGPIQVSSGFRGVLPDDSRTQIMVLPVQELHVLGPIVYTEALIGGVEKRITVPRSLLADVVLRAAGRERSEALFSELLHVAGQKLMGSRVPDTRKAEVKVALAVMGMVTYVEAETNLLHTMHEFFGSWFVLHRTLVSFGRVRVRHVIFFMCWGLILAAAPLLGDVWVHDHWYEVLSVLLASFVLVLCVCCLPIVARLAQELRTWRVGDWRARLRDNTAPTASHMPLYTPLLGSETSLPGTTFVRVPATDINGVVEFDAPKDNPRAPARSIMAGIVNSATVANVLEPTQDVEHSAVTHRILRAVQGPQLKAVQQLCSDIRESKDFMKLGKPLDRSRVYAFGYFNSLKQYSSKYRDLLKEAWSKFIGTTADWVNSQLFIKLEKGSIEVSLEGQATGTKPRLINAPPIEDKSILSPLISQIQRDVEAKWTGWDDESPIMYCSGYTTDAIGARVDQFIESAGGEDKVVGINVDFSTYDVTLKIELQDAIFENVYKTKYGLTTAEVTWLTHIRMRGKTPHGVRFEGHRYFSEEEEYDEFVKIYASRYKLKHWVERSDEGRFVRGVVEDFEMASGRADTNLMDSLVNAATYVGILGSTKYLLLICGDDGFLMMLKTDLHLFERVVIFQKELGLIPESLICSGRHDWEFCSKLFWYATDPLRDDRTVTVLGQKPGRGIVRLGSTITVAGAANIAKSSKDVLDNNAHVPFLRVWAKKTSELCVAGGVKPKGYEFQLLKATRRYKGSTLNWALTEQRYGLGEVSEKELIDLLCPVTSLQTTVTWTPLVAMCARDRE